jgi:hypothetical protein
MVEVHGVDPCRRRIVVHEFGDESAPPEFGIAHRSIDVEDRRPVRVGVRPRIEVRPVFLPDDEVRDAVAVNVATAAPCGLRECDVAGSSS